ncbi:sensor histidine kinase [Paenibacillus sp. MSJ-34]|uniref:cache domain-containing sensor histidine kinase n=1 Tax=Paenibacillus sp. MSJ-34 TaxID=2841529 RepID=UPI001C0FEE13|nr:sensor histidine kinase [Paenibacillus sp. MSJ-34]MBU5445109.1 sensor histidine kinase [Paenibacillus sp. MSJ-34]
MKRRAKYNPFRTISNGIRNARLRTKILLSNMIIILLITTAIGSASIYTANYFLESNTKDLSAQIVHQVSDNIEYRAREFMNSTVYLISDQLLRDFLTERAEAVTEDNYAAYQYRVNYVLAQFASNNRYIRSIVIKNNKGTVYWWENKHQIQNELNVHSASQIMSQAEAELRSSGHEYVWTSSFRGEDEVSLTRNFIDLNHVNVHIGTVLINIDPNFFRNLKSDISYINPDNIAIFNQNDQVLVKSNFRQPERDALFGNGQSESAAANGAIRRIEGQNYLITQKQTSPSGWRVVCVIPMTMLKDHTRLLQWMILIFSALAILISIAISWFLSATTTKNIKLLEKNMRKVEEGDFQVRTDIMGRDEVGMLSVRFNFMVGRINELVNSVYKERIAKQQAEFQVLMAQINPHFLYNTLGTIKWFARMKGQSEIEKMTGSLFELLKSSVRRTSEFHTLAEEIMLLDNYIFIQKMGYGDELQIKFDIDERLLQCYVPYLSLQPLLENAILHGIEPSKGNALITIRAWRENERIYLVVEDNGVGMDEQKIEQIVNGRGQEDKRFPGMSSIGVRGVNERIQLYYGKEYGLLYESQPGRGTKAKIKLPYHTKLEEAEHIAAGYDR